MITYAYKPISLDILVYKENDYIGDIVKNVKGYSFHRKDSLEGGYVFDTLARCKLALEIDNSTDEFLDNDDAQAAIKDAKDALDTAKFLKDIDRIGELAKYMLRTLPILEYMVSYLEGTDKDDEVLVETIEKAKEIINKVKGSI